jgi:hypothetical protein
VSVFCPEQRQEESGFWSQEDPEYGWIHLADRKAENFRAGVLVVFVHGIFGESRESWGDTPRLALEAAKIDADAFSFRFPASLTENADVMTAAAALGAALREKFSSYHHLYFCVHSTGGLVVKAMMLEESADLRAETDVRPRDFRFINSIALRTRRILNLDVPHGGGEYWKSNLGGFVYKWAARPLLQVLRAVRIWPYPVGLNQIVSQLKHGNEWVLELEKRYHDFVTELDVKGLPRPVSIEFISDDNAIGAFEEIVEEHAGRRVRLRSDAEKVPLRGNHSTHKLATRNTDMIAGVLAKRLHTAVHAQTLAVTTQSVALIYDFERALRLVALVGDVSSAEINSRGETIGTQASIDERLRTFLSAGAERVRSVVITGDAGVGKSVVIRRLARTLILSHLNRDDDSKPLAIVVPLQRVKFTKDQANEFNRGANDGRAWNVLALDWCAYVNGILERDRAQRPMETGAELRMPKLEFAWLQRRLSQDPAVLIFDGVDEFLSNNLLIGFDEFHGMVRKLQEDFGRNTSLTILLGVRSSQGGIDTLAGSKQNIFRVRRLKISEANSIYRGAKEWIERFHDEELQDLLLTPLILAQLGPRLDKLSPENLSSRAAILEAALDAILEKADLELPDGDRPKRAIDSDQWKDALSLVAWRYHAGSRATMGVEQLRSECEATLGKAAFAIDRPLTWRMLLDPPLELTNKYPLLAEKNPALRKFVDNLALTTACETIHVLMRTIFFPTDELTFRFLHRDWQDFLASRYFADCVRYDHADELRDQASTQSMFKMAGEQMSDLAVKRDRMEFFLGRSQDLKRHYIVGNFLALINNSVIPIEGPVLSLLFAVFDRIEGIAGHVTLAGLGYRALNAHRQPEGDRRDPTAAAIRKNLEPLLQKIASLENHDATLPVTIHMARCYLAALGEDSTGDMASEKLAPTLTERSPEHDEATLLQVATRTATGFDLTTPQRSLQRAFLEIQSLVTERHEPARPIAVVHYLFFLSLAHYYDAGIGELHEELPRLLRRGSALEAEIEKYNLPPLTALYRQCQRMLRIVT